MKKPSRPEPELLKTFHASDPVFVDETGLATIWKVVRHNGQPAALKVYHTNDMRNEAQGFDLLEAWDGRGAALLFQRNSFAALIEWLDGPSLGDLTRQGRDRLACQELVEAANRIHTASHIPNPGFPQLEDWFQSLFDVSIGPGCPKETRRDIAKCQAVARKLLATQRDVVPLHGDLHHDNIRLGERGYCVFDAKGVLGDRAYELANAFRNPKGAEQIVRDPARITYLAKVWAEAFGVERQRLLDWAAAKCALSIAWRAKGAVDDDQEFDLMSSLVGISEQRQ